MYFSSSVEFCLPRECIRSVLSLFAGNTSVGSGSDSPDESDYSDEADEEEEQHENDEDGE